MSVSGVIKEWFGLRGRWKGQFKTFRQYPSCLSRIAIIKTFHYSTCFLCQGLQSKGYRKTTLRLEDADLCATQLVNDLKININHLLTDPLPFILKFFVHSLRVSPIFLQGRIVTNKHYRCIKYFVKEGNM